MGRILFLDAQLTGSIPTIIKLFSPIFKDERTITLLKNIQNDKYKTPELIIGVCSSTSCLDICHKFVNALSKALYYYNEYDLIIIDRNLSEVPYHEDLQDIKEYLQKCGFSDVDKKIDMYTTREGDLILLALLRLDRNNKNKIYYLTANIDELKGSPELETLIDVDDFYRNHIIEKTTDKDKVLTEIVANLESFSIQNRFATHVKILRNRLNEDEVDLFVNMIRHYDNDSRREFIIYLRKILDNLMHHIAGKMNEPNASYWNKANPDQLIVKTFIKGFYAKDNDYLGRFSCGLPVFDQKHSIGYSSIVRNACLSIFEICSDCGIHDLNTVISPEGVNINYLTEHTMKSMLNQICDVILWYDKAIVNMQKASEITHE